MGKCIDRWTHDCVYGRWVDNEWIDGCIGAGLCCVNLTPDRVIWEEEASIGKMTLPVLINR